MFLREHVSVIGARISFSIGSQQLHRIAKIMKSVFYDNTVNEYWFSFERHVGAR